MSNQQTALEIQKQISNSFAQREREIDHYKNDDECVTFFRVLACLIFVVVAMFSVWFFVPYSIQEHHMYTLEQCDVLNMRVNTVYDKKITYSLVGDLHNNQFRKQLTFKNSDDITVIEKNRDFLQGTKIDCYVGEKLLTQQEYIYLFRSEIDRNYTVGMLILLVFFGFSLFLLFASFYLTRLASEKMRQLNHDRKQYVDKISSVV